MNILQQPFHGSIGAIALLSAVLGLGGCGDSTPSGAAEDAQAPAVDQPAEPSAPVPAPTNRIPPREPAPIPPGNPTDTSHLLSVQTLDAARQAAEAAEKNAAEQERAAREANLDLDGT